MKTVSIRKILKSIILLIIEKIGFVSSGKYKLLFNKYSLLTDLYFSLMDNCREKYDYDNEVLSIVFSKDRAMQLHAFLRSYLAKIKNRSKMVVLYKTTNEEHAASYNDLIDIFQNDDIVFIKEISFRQQLLEIIKHATAKNILFFVDDMIFTHDFNYDILKQIDTQHYILSLNHGRDFTYTTVLQKDMKLPEFREIYGMLAFNWDYSEEFSDWTFPLGVSGYMYGKEEIYAMLNIVDFNAPNTLEAAMGKFYSIFLNRYGLCTDNAVAVCVHTNIVQTYNHNPVLDYFSVEELLKLWNQNKQIDISAFFNKPANIAQTMKYSFLDNYYY